MPNIYFAVTQGFSRDFVKSLSKVARWEGSLGPLSEIDARLARHGGKESRVSFKSQVGAHICQHVTVAFPTCLCNRSSKGATTAEGCLGLTLAWVILCGCVPPAPPFHSFTLYFSLPVSLPLSCQLSLCLSLTYYLAGKFRPTCSWREQNFTKIRSNQCTTLCWSNLVGPVFQCPMLCCSRLVILVFLKLETVWP